MGDFRKLEVWRKLECELVLAENLEFASQQVSRETFLTIGSIRGMLQTLHRRLPTARANPLDPRP
jgi:hypothetical protein